MVYYNVVKNWRKIKPHLTDTELNNILVEDFHKYTFGRWQREFKHGMFPRDFESCDWDCGRKGRKPEFWMYVKHAACHWLVNFNLRLAMLIAPDHKWRILTSNEHSSVWDGEQTLFDLNYLAMGVPPDEAYEAANDEELPIGEFMEINFALPHSIENAQFRDLWSRVSKEELAEAMTSEVAMLNAIEKGSDEFKELFQLVSQSYRLN